MPGLIDLYEAHEKHRDKFEIIAFHDGTVSDFPELDKKLESIKKSVWAGKDLPFPILLDSTGETIKTYDIHSFPTTILIDPEGKLVGEAGEDLLESKLPKLPAAVRAARRVAARPAAVRAARPAAVRAARAAGSSSTSLRHEGRPSRAGPRPCHAAGTSPFAS